MNAHEQATDGADDVKELPSTFCPILHCTEVEAVARELLAEIHPLPQRLIERFQHFD